MTRHVDPSVAAALATADDLSRDAGALVRAALAGPQEFDDALAAVPGGHDADVITGDTDTPVAPGGGVYLRGMTVTGFRGIGDPVELSLAPAPGLVLVTGRNGSGKSSIAEACELALSGGSVRAAESPMWSEGLMNLHRGGGATVEIALRVDGAGDVTVTCALDGDDIARAHTSARAGEDEYDLESLGWSDAIGRYRPVLTYGELAALASAKPSKLYDPINNMVGLERLTAADRLLTKAATEQGKPPKEATAARKALLAALTESGDPRATGLAAALGGTTPDAAAARAVLAGAAGPTDDVRRACTAWSTLAAPDPVQAADAAKALRDARDRADRASASAAGRAARLAELLDLAIAHREHNDDPCPVCGQGVLDDAWLENAQRQALEARNAAAEATGAALALRTAREHARRYIPSMPAVLSAPAAEGVDPAAAEASWVVLRALDDPSLPDAERDHAIAAGLQSAAQRVADEVAALAMAAAAALAAKDSAWQPIAEQAGEALRLMGAADIARDRLGAVTDARAWLTSLTGTLRRERMSRFRDEATAIWNGLRQESNVSLEGIELVGANTRRQARLDLTVDGTPGPQAVLSQGELAALGLSLFLPRSTADESPFRFLLIDDPVQSMDPSKIDGLARVLHQLAQKRQVIVFTHDDRLLQALQRLALAATAYSIVRGERSVVRVERTADPVEQHLRDARALAKDAALPEDLVAIAVTGCCRDAIDEAANEVARRRLLDAGVTAAVVDEQLASAGTTWQRLALALLGDRRRTGKPLNAAIDAVDAGARAVISACVEGVHEPDAAALIALPDQTAMVVAALRAQ
jgi:energy-coupling factor transporter ATP-binding protein EcfA2